jgi:probable rRNA maturation factor
MNATRPSERAAARPPAVLGAAVAVQYAVRRVGLPAPATIARWLDAALQERARITVRFVGAAEGRRLNRIYRGTDHATNVLSFAYAPLAADIVLCVPVIAREAKEQGKALLAHYAHLVVHGALHVQGFDHERALDAQLMERREVRILASLGFADPYS